MSWLRTKTNFLREEVFAVLLALRDSRTPWLARGIVLGILLYIASPWDIIPDFIPLAGVVDDVILVPLGFWLMERLIPPAVLADHRREAKPKVARLRRWLWLVTGLLIIVCVLLVAFSAAAVVWLARAI